MNTVPIDIRAIVDMHRDKDLGAMAPHELAATSARLIATVDALQREHTAIVRLLAPIALRLMKANGEQQ